MAPTGINPDDNGPPGAHEGLADQARLVHDRRGHEEDDMERIKEIPKELGVMLLTAGIVGVILPGPGAPAIIAGGLALWPEAFGKIESWLVRSHPKVHRQGVRQINRFLNDLEKRYPSEQSD